MHWTEGHAVGQAAATAMPGSEFECPIMARSRFLHGQTARALNIAHFSATCYNHYRSNGMRYPKEKGSSCGAVCSTRLSARRTASQATGNVLKPA